MADSIQMARQLEQIHRTALETYQRTRASRPLRTTCILNPTDKAAQLIEEAARHMEAARRLMARAQYLPTIARVKAEMLADIEDAEPHAYQEAEILPYFHKHYITEVEQPLNL